MRIEALGEDYIGWAVPLENAERRLPLQAPLQRPPPPRLAEGECFGLSKQIGHQEIVLFDKRTYRLPKANEVAGDQFGPLVEQLIE